MDKTQLNNMRGLYIDSILYPHYSKWLDDYPYLKILPEGFRWWLFRETHDTVSILQEHFNKELINTHSLDIPTPSEIAKKQLENKLRSC